MNERRTSVTVVVPSFGRPETLSSCLRGVAAQGLRPDEVLVVARSEDQATQDVARRHEASLVLVDAPGAVAAVDRGIRRAASEIVAILDDDAIPATDWISRIVASYEARPQLGALGGRDNIHGDQASGSIDLPVGRIARGRIVGNHHLGMGIDRRAHHLKGANMAVARTAATALDWATLVEGSGAQIRWEFVLSLAIESQGLEVRYDPRIQVDHYPAARPEADGREEWTPVKSRVLRHNEAVAISRFGTPMTVAAYVARSFLIGDSRAPGTLAVVPLMLAHRDPSTWNRWWAGMRGLAAGIKTGHESAVAHEARRTRTEGL